MMSCGRPLTDARVALARIALFLYRLALLNLALFFDSTPLPSLVLLSIELFEAACNGDKPPEGSPRSRPNGMDGGLGKE